MRTSPIYHAIKILLTSTALLMAVGCAVSTETQDESLGSSVDALEKGSGAASDSSGDSIGDPLDDGSVARNAFEEWAACVNKCQTPDRIDHHYCDWYCTCLVYEKKNRLVCESEDPFIDIRETPPLPPLKELEPVLGISP
jgi:hypothetical protein